MKRDMEIVREILLEVEAQKASKVSKIIPSEDENNSDYMEHISLLIDEGFLTGKVIRGAQMQIAAISIIPPGLTWSGHDFLDAARSDTVWKKAMGKVKDAGGSITFELMKSLLKKLAAQQLGLE